MKLVSSHVAVSHGEQDALPTLTYTRIHLDRWRHGVGKDQDRRSRDRDRNFPVSRPSRDQDHDSRRVQGHGHDPHSHWLYIACVFHIDPSMTPPLNRFNWIRHWSRDHSPKFNVHSRRRTYRRC